MKSTQGKIHYNWFIIGVLTATFWLTVSANYDDYPTECPKIDPINYTVLLPHETDCDKYYACSNGRKILMHCPLMDNDGNRLYFSAELHVCVYPEQSGCTPQSTTTEQTSEPTETTTKEPTTTSELPSPTTTQAPTTTTEPPPPTTTQAPTTTTESLTTASEEVSTTNPSTTTTEQPTSSTGTSTNEPSITTTELPSSSTVLTTTNVPTTTEITSTTGQSTSSTGSNSNEPPSTTTVQTSSTTEPSTESPTLCSESTSGVYFPHESYPHLYYECNYGDLIRRECTESTLFDETSQTCVWSPDASFNEELTTEVPTTIEPTNSSEISSICSANSLNSCERHSHECDCHKFYVCNNGDAILRTCPSNLAFNPTLKECDLSENSQCGNDNGDGNTSTTPIPTQCPPDNTGWAVHLPHETNCSLFYKCNWGEKVVLPCRPGLHFNPKLQVCDWPCAAGCTAEGGDGSNTCNSPNHPGNGIPEVGQSFLRFSVFKNIAFNDYRDDDNSLDDKNS